MTGENCVNLLFSLLFTFLGNDIDPPLSCMILYVGLRMLHPVCVSVQGNLRAAYARLPHTERLSKLKKGGNSRLPMIAPMANGRL